MDKSDIQRYTLPIVAIVYGGGTISSLATSAGHREGGHTIDLVQLLKERMPYYMAPFEVGEKRVAYTGLSENMDPSYWKDIDANISAALSQRPNGVLLTHGTDSMEQTAKHLQEVFTELLTQTGTRIVLTGANEDITYPTTDAWDNLQFGLESAASYATGHGVFVAFHRRLIPADEVVKLPYIEDGDSTFVSVNDPNYDAKRTQQAERSVTLILSLHKAYDHAPDKSTAIVYSVNTIRPNHNELLDYVSDHHVQAVVLRLYHSGTANTEKPFQSVAGLVKKLREEHGIVCYGVTENGEPVDLHSYGTSVKLREAGVVPLYDMSGRVALYKLRLIGNKTPAESIDEMLDSKVGEIDPARIISKDINALKKLYKAKRTS